MIFGILLASTLAFSVSRAAFNGVQQAIIPAYMYPGPVWDTMIGQKPAIVVANPDSGPVSGHILQRLHQQS